MRMNVATDTLMKHLAMSIVHRNTGIVGWQRGKKNDSGQLGHKNSQDLHAAEVYQGRMPSVQGL